MRCFRWVVVACALIGCVQEKVSVLNPLDSDEANGNAAKIALLRDLKVTKKEVLVDKNNYRVMHMVFNLDEQMTDPRSGLRIDEVKLEIDDSHRFFSEFDSLKVGERTFFIHMSHLGGSVKNPATFLAPNTPITSEYFRRHYY